MIKGVQIYTFRISDDGRLDACRLRERMPLRYEKTMRMQKEEARLLTLGAGQLMIEALGISSEKEILYGEHGKPYLKGGPPFNLSHSGDRAVLAVGETEIGVDIERPREVREAVAERVFTADELAFVREDFAERFFTLWTLKESVMKATGKGFTLAPEKFSAMPLLAGEWIEADGRRWRAETWCQDGYHISVCTEVPTQTA